MIPAARIQVQNPEYFMLIIGYNWFYKGRGVQAASNLTAPKSHFGLLLPPI
jgi:hypothetical protein